MDKPLIYITRKMPEELLEPYESIVRFDMWEDEHTPVPREVLLEKVKQADGIVCMLTEQIDQELLEQALQLKIVANMAVGYDNIDIEAAQQKHIMVTNTPDVLTETTADLTFALLMATARRLIEASDYIREDKWGPWSPFQLAGADVHHKTIGIVGMGRIGEAVAKRAKGFGMSILYYNRSRKYEAENTLGAVYTEFDTLLEKADFVVSLAPLTAETKHVFNEQAFQKMKKSAIFINASRGGTMDERALYKALQEKEITAAGLDVFEKEPIRNNHPLVNLDNVVCLPHIGSASMETRVGMFNLCLDNIALFFAGDKPKTPVI